eukprot:12592456-Alexandrium_andersonii.AAC.1
MSASLVGSEMCIRDSARSTNSRGGRHGATRATTAASHAANAQCRQEEDCLLYTSDAADDM